MEQAGSRICRVRPGAHGRARLRDPVDGGRRLRERRRRAHVLLLADGGRPNGGWTDVRIADAPGTSVVTAERTGGRCVMEGLDAALERRVHSNRKKPRPGGEGQATLATLAMPGCPEPPGGHARWTLRPRGDRLVELEVVDSIGRETVRQAPEKTASGPG